MKFCKFGATFDYLAVDSPFDGTCMSSQKSHPLVNERLQKYLKTKEGNVITDSKALLCDHGNTAAQHTSE